ncbi:alpha/beta fold hydrolase [Aeromicrobium sp. A1-2]|uniref:alpha/beta fold hydrolase n=1 Tax=Aeromicrobium sp. A1-2 TaxID=2107713 RepID=UPI0013C31592|nr:alpha/beta fold hydrolase [Aeromicrobium sp. A1-2]
MATSADGTAIAYDRIGSGPALILLPGATCTRGILASLAETLSAHFTVFAVDRRGRGDSDDMAAPPPYAVEREVEDVEALVAAAGGSAALYGHSSGAALALHATAAEIGVTRLVMHDAPYSTPSMEQAARDWHVHLHETLADDRPGDAVAAFMQKVGLPEQAITGMRNGPGWPAMEAVGSSLAYDSAAMGDAIGGVVPRDLASRVSVPTLVLVGGADLEFMLDAADQLVAALPDGRLEHLVGARHDAGPEVVVPGMLPFLLA